MHISEVVKRVREDKGLTQEQLAEKIKVHFTTVNRWEKNKRSIPGDKLEQIAKVFEMSVSELYNYTDSQKFFGKKGFSTTQRRTISLMVHLDGTPGTLKSCIDTLQQVNALL